MALAKTRRFACIVALGCVIRGDTPHFDYVSSEAASGLQLAAIETGVPVAFGLLTLDRADQAESRVHKGAEAVRTASRWPTCSRTSAPQPRGNSLPPPPPPPPPSIYFRYHPKPHVQDLLTLREEARLRQQPEPLDGRNQAALQPEPAAGPGVAEARRRAYVCTRCLKAGKVTKAI